MRPRIHTPTEQAAAVILAVVIATLAAAALLHWATPCDTAHLCALAAITPTRTSYAHRACAWARALYLRVLLRGVESDIDSLLVEMQLARWELQHYPEQVARHQAHADRLRRELDSCNAVAAGAR